MLAASQLIKPHCFEPVARLPTLFHDMPGISLLVVLACLFALVAESDGAKKMKLGRALALSQADWDSWLQFIMDRGSCRLWVLLTLTGMFALRCGEACMACAEDFELDHDPPRLVVRSEPGRSKSPGDIPILPEQREIIETWMRDGVVADRSQTVNQHGGTRVFKDHFKWPKIGRLFAGRDVCGDKRTKKDHLGYHAVYVAVRDLYDKFTQEMPHLAVQWQRLRTHSGRATKITLLMGEGVSLSMSMRFARHAHDSIRKRLQGMLQTPTQAALLAPERTGLEGCGLGELISWREKGLLSESEFEKAKALLWKRAGLKDLVEWREAGLVTENDFEQAKALLPCFK